MDTLKIKNNGFTLVEIIIVLVILGVLVTIALPGLFAQIERNRAQEAINTMNFIKSSIETCGLQNNYQFSQCNNWTSLNMLDPSYNTPPGSNMGSNFIYTLGGGNAYGLGTYSIKATRTGILANFVVVNRNSDGSVTCTGNGAYVGFC